MLELYHNNISVCAQKVRIVLSEKHLPWTNTGTTPRGFIALNCGVSCSPLARLR